jgi:hypothetical protein
MLRNGLGRWKVVNQSCAIRNIIGRLSSWGISHEDGINYYAQTGVLWVDLLDSCRCVGGSQADGDTPGVDGPRPGGYSLAWQNKTKAGTSVLIYQTTSINPDCSPAGIPEVKVVSGPSHGKVEFLRVPVLPNVTPKSKCYSVKVPGVKARYTPDAGFVGADKVRIRNKLIEGGFAYGNITISVSK